MMSCKQVSDIIDSDQKLTFIQKWQLKFHLMICRRCALAKKQMEIISRRLKLILTSELPSDQDSQSINQIISKITTDQS